MGESPLMRVCPEFKKYVEEVSKRKGFTSSRTTQEFLKTLKNRKVKKKKHHSDWGIISVK